MKITTTTNAATASTARGECGPAVHGQENRCEYHRAGGAFHRACDADPRATPPRDLDSPDDGPIGRLPVTTVQAQGHPAPGGPR